MVESGAGGGGHSYRVSIGRYRASYGPTALQEFCQEVTTFVPFPTTRKKEGPIDLMKPMLWTRKLDNDTYFPTAIMETRQVEGKICVYDGEFTDAVIEAAAKTEMLALIVTKPPTELPMLPVFCLTKHAVKEALAWGDDAKVVVKYLPGPPSVFDDMSAKSNQANVENISQEDEALVTHSSVTNSNKVGADDGLPGNNDNPTPSQPYRESKSSKGTGTAHPLQTDQLQRVLDSSARPFDETETSRPSYLTVATTTPAQSTPSASTGRDSPSEEDDESQEILCDGDDDDFGGTDGGAKARSIKKKRGMLSAALSAVSGAVFGSDQAEEFFRHGAGWTKKENFKDYRKAMGASSTYASNSRVAESVVKTMPRFLQDSGGNSILKLAFAGRLWTWVECDGKDDLVDTIIGILARYDFVAKKPDFEALQRPFREDWMKPNVALGRFFTDLVKNRRVRGQHKSNNKLWVNIFWLWMRSGLIKSPIDWQSWRTLRKIVGSEFLLESGELLRRLFPKTRLSTLSLFLQEDVHGAQSTLMLLKGEALGYQRVDPAVEELVKEFARLIVAGDSRDRPAADEWKLMFEVLGGCFFVSKKKTEDVYKRLIDFFMHEASFANNGNFQLYPCIIDGFGRLSAGDPFKAFARKGLQQAVRSDLGMEVGRPSPKAVHELLSCSWSSLNLNEPPVLGAILKYVHRAFETSTISFQDKLLLLDGLHDLKGEAWIMSKGETLRVLRGSLSLHRHRDVIEQAYQSSMDYRGIFGDSKGNKRISQFVSKAIVDLTTKECLINDLSLVQTVILASECSTTSGAFAQCLAVDLKGALVRECTSMSTTCLFFARMVESTQHDKVQSLCVASVLFYESFSSWRPRSFNDMAPEGSQVLNIFFDCLHRLDEAKDVADVSSCKNDVRQVFVRWLDDFQSDQLSCEGLIQGLVLSKYDVWPLISSQLDLELPATDKIEQKEAEFDDLVGSISHSLSAPIDWNHSLGDLLRAYNCPGDQDRQLSHLFKMYSLFVKAVPGAEFEDGFREEAVFTRTLKLIRKDAEEATAFWDSCAPELNVCDHFIDNPSMIFQDNLTVASPSGYSDVYELQRCVGQACESVKGLFCLEAPLDEIKEAVVSVQKSKVSPEEEMAALRRCSFLALVYEDGDRFLLTSLVCRIYEPLAGLVTFCEQFKFAGVQSDVSFLKVKQIIDDIVRRNQIDEPEEQCRRLRGHLFTENEDAAVAGYDATKLEALLPLLKLLACLSNHQEIWKLAQEKKWFGKEGLNGFLKELDHLSNIHMDSYNETFLEVMEPVIRVISVVGGVITETKLASLLESLLCNQHLQEWLEQGRFRDFEVVQLNLGEVRRWFCEDQDEIAGVYRDFEAIYRTGRYFLDAGASESGVSLCLEYSIDSDSKMQKMNSSETQAFTEQLTIIQHDDSAMSKSIESFLEHHSIIHAGAQNVIKLENIGALDSGYLHFECSVGMDYVKEAQNLLEESRRRLERCEVWLQNTWKRYPLSLLFWPEELRELHRLGKQQYDVRVVAPKLIRLFPPAQCLDSERKQKLMETLFMISETSSQSQTESWLLEVSRFVQNVYEALEAPRKSVSYGGGREVVVHTVSCDGEYKDEQVLHILQTVYKDRLPMDYEVLDGLSKNFAERLPIFLERTKLFSSSVFVILNIEEVKKEYVSTIRSFLQRDTASENLRLHCIQREPTLPQVSPFFEHKTWANDDMSQLSHSAWRERIVDDNTIKSATLILSSSCCTGKTRYARAQQQRLAETVENAEIGTITVHDRSTADDLAAAIASKYSHASVERSLHISILSIPEGGSEARAAWLQQLNKFFFALLVLRVINHSTALSSFHVADGNWTVFVEFPSNEVTIENWKHWVRRHVPVLGLVCQPVEPPTLFHINDEARRVGTYLRAYDDGSIDDTFEPAARKRIVFVLDRSESMEYEVADNQTQLSAATDCALGIFDSHVQCDDVVGVVLFNHQSKDVVSFQTVDSDAHKAVLRSQLDGARRDIPLRGGTHMYSALSRVVDEVERGPAIETWIVVLTDGDTDRADTDTELRQQLHSSRDSLHVIIVGINLFPDYEEKMRLLCQKYDCTNVRRTKGFYVGSDSTLESLQKSFLLVSKEIPVSHTFDLLGAPTDEECRILINKHAPFGEVSQNMLLLSFWVRFLYRRVKIFDMNDTFNYNETRPKIGSCLMTTMLSEISRLVQADQQRDWLERNYAQLVYDFTDPESPEFRLLCTSPKLMDEGLKQEYEHMELPGFSVPSETSLSKRSTLDKMISQAMGVPMEVGSDGEESLRCIDERGFVLTLDFTVKILNIHERVATAVPCIIEGETGVSKTALTEMYSFLRNSAMTARTGEETILSLATLEEEIQSLGYPTGFGSSPVERFASALRAAQSVGLDSETTLSTLLHQKMLKLVDARSPVFEDMPLEFADSKTSTVVKLVEWFGDSQLERTFFELNVHSSLGESDVVACFRPIRAVARKLFDLDALIVVFLDEINTSSTLGLLKEIVVDRSLQGEMLEENIVVVAACNPVRRNLMLESGNHREADLGRSWTSGHYQVAELPPSMSCMKWHFGSLNKDQEKDFIRRRIKTLAGTVVPLSLHISMTEVISASQEAMREFAVQDLKRNLRRQNKYTDQEIREQAVARSKCVVSLRDIQRVFVLFNFFLRDFPVVTALPNSSPHRRAMFLSVAVVYFLRLDSHSRQEYLSLLKELPGERHQTQHLQDVLNAAMEQVILNTNFGPHIARTRGLKENLFATLVCTLSRTPLMIVGPPGCSKTLSVNAVGDNASGEESPSSFYRQFARLSFYHYQCSKESTSTEIAAVFDKATRRQKMVDSKTTRFVIFMDEAGLPEEKRESLKVLHFLLENGGDVSFIAVSNHVVDAAKANRACMCFRSEPDEEEMLAITQGVLLGCKKDDGSMAIRQVDLGDGHLVDSKAFAGGLCQAYSALLHDITEYPWLDTFFGLRDYIYFLKAVRLRALFVGVKMVLSPGNIIFAIERNFNGVQSKVGKRVSFEILRHLLNWTDDALTTYIEGAFRCPTVVISEALSQGNQVNCLQMLESRTRFKLIIDCSDDDSIMRLLNAAGLLDLGKKTLFKLSQLPEEREREKLRLISGVKFAAMQGHTVLLSQTESVDESFYDLQNQNFREIEAADGTVSLYANIAAGGVSHRSPVDASFNCIVHVRESELAHTPAPFLNRFEKYRLDLRDVLSSGWASLGGLVPCLQQSRQRTGQLIGLLGEKGLVGWEDNGRSLDSIYVGFLPQWALLFGQPSDASNLFVNSNNDKTLVDCLLTFLDHVSSIHTSKTMIGFILESALEGLPQDLAVVLRQMMDENAGAEIERYQALLTGLLDGEKMVDAEFATMQEVCVAVIQMIFTHYAVTALLFIATPEAVYARNHCLPRFLVEGYFSQEHFSLKQLLSRVMASDDSQLLVAHTRTDTSIHSIPSYNMQTDHPDKTWRGDRDTVRALVCEADDTVLVEHLSLLRSESSFRKALMDWTSNSNKRVFVLLVDMSKSKAFEKVNYARMSVEQCSLGNKIFLLLLHYPPSNSVRSSSYPALFLGNWKHVFLDGIGQSGPSLGLSESIQVACKGSPVNNSNLKAQLCDAFSQMLPTVVSHLACKNVFYKSQGEHQNSRNEGLFLARRKFVTAVFATPLDTGTVGSVLAHKFAVFWLGQGLESTVRTACMRLQRGTTLLSVTGSIHSTILETFDKFMGWYMKEMNAWRGLDLLQSGTKEVVDLFGFILEEFPVLPFDELVLLRERGTTVQAMPPTLDSLQDEEGPTVQFPFFFFVSSCLEEVLEYAASKLVESVPEKDVYIDTALLFKSGMEVLSNPSSTVNDSYDGVSSSRQNLVCSVVETVRQSGALFDRYIRQFVEWKASCLANPFICYWLDSSVKELKGGFNIFAVHCVARCCQIEFMKAASWSVMARRHPLAPRIKKEAIGSSLWQSELLLHTLGYLECAATQKELDLQKWSSTFSSLLHQLIAIKGADKNHICRVRALCVANLLVQIPAYDEGILKEIIDGVSSATEGAAMHTSTPADLSDTTRKKDKQQQCQLSRLFGFLKGDERLEEALLQQFFSPFSLATMQHFHMDDFNFLLDAIADGTLRKHSHQSQVSLLSRACTYFGSHDGKPVTCDDNLGIPVFALNLINSKLSLACQDTSQFADAGLTVAFPHFIPRWLKVEGAVDNGDRHDGNPPNHLGYAFFSMYNNTFGGTVASTAFEMLLRIVLHQNEDASSTTILLRLLENLENPERLTGLRGHERESSSLVGSNISAMIIDALTICFVAGLARDLANFSDESALSGPYNEICQHILQGIMQIPSARFADFFFSQVRRQKGEACLMRLLSSQGPLHDFPWCQEIRDGMPTLVEGQEEALRQAEAAFADKHEDEQQKQRDLKLCPNCRLPFGVAARECGQFVCGQNAHGAIGRGGEVYGCRQSFHVDTAPRYRIDEEVLAPLRAVVEVQRASLSTAHQSEKNWDRARDYKVPELVFMVDGIVRANLVPTVSMIGSCDDDEQSEFLRVLIQGTESAKDLSLLADLVEFYVWLHSVFGQILSKEVAMDITVADVMKPERLLRRFDPVHTKHMISLWERVVKNVNCLLEKLEYKVSWGCTLIDIPFNHIEAASLITLLSEGADPTDGFDFLFLIINQIITRYNNFVRQLSEVSKSQGPSDDQGERFIHPKFIMSGTVNQLAVMSRFELESVVAGSWSAELGRFDMAQIDQSLRYSLSLLKLPPFICNPVDCLRAQFVFRNESVTNVTTENLDNLVYQSSDGTFFARAQDLELIRLVQEGLKAKGLASPDVSTRHLLCVEFQKELDSHNKTCAMLVGLRNLLGALPPETNSFEFASLKDGLNFVFSKNGDGGMMEDNLNVIGFPELGAGSVALLVSLCPDQIVELARYLGFQLASEGYLYSELPLCMSEPLPKAVIEELVISLEDFSHEKTPENALDCLKAFVGDVLVYYETQIKEESVVRNQPLRDFLAGKNFCGTEDPVFALLSRNVGLQNYIALRQQLQQVELSLLYRLAAAPDGEACSERHGDPLTFANKSAGECLLWQPEGGETVEQVPIRIPTHNNGSVDGLWFADCPTRRSDAAASSSPTGASKPLRTTLSKEQCACRIQCWWRRQRSIDQESAMSIESGSEDDAYFNDALSDMQVDDMDMEEELEEFCDYDEVEIPVVEEGDDLAVLGGGESSEQATTCEASLEGAPGSSYARAGAEMTSATNTTSMSQRERMEPIDPGSVAGTEENSLADMRTWLTENGLPTKMVDDLENLGIRSVDDLILTAKECEGILDDLPRLDQHKLKMAIRNLQ